jgi:tight adherence protein C
MTHHSINGFVLTIVLSGVAATCLCFAISLWFQSPARARNRADSSEHLIVRPVFWRCFSFFISPIEQRFSRWLPHETSKKLNGFLNSADLGRELSPAALVAAAIVAALLGGAIAFALTRSIGVNGGQAFAIGACLMGCLPFMWIRDQSIRREQQILRQLPFVLDLITLAVESGLNLSAALVETVEKGPAGVLRNELSLVLRDVRAGTTRAEALQAMSERMRLPAVSNLVAGLIAADRQGGAIGVLLRGQSLQRRNERFARAEKLAMQAPVKMLFPLIAFIFPCTFIILLFPVFHRMVAEGWLR